LIEKYDLDVGMHIQVLRDRNDSYDKMIKVIGFDLQKGRLLVKFCNEISNPTHYDAENIVLIKKSKEC
jgi:hypothetical protein